MKILTNKQYEELLKQNRSEAYAEGYVIGNQVGHDDGYHKGLKQDRTGVVLTSRGIHIFNGNVNIESL